MNSTQKATEARRKGGKPAFRNAVRALYDGGLSALDGRSKAARAVSTWRSGVEADLGGDLSVAQRTLLEVASNAMEAQEPRRSIQQAGLRKPIPEPGLLENPLF